MYMRFAYLFSSIICLGRGYNKGIGIRSSRLRHAAEETCWMLWLGTACNDIEIKFYIFLHFVIFITSVDCMFVCFLIVNVIIGYIITYCTHTAIYKENPSMRMLICLCGDINISPPWCTIPMIEHGTDFRNSGSAASMVLPDLVNLIPTIG